MTSEIGLWRIDGKPQRVMPSRLDLEATLESLIESDPDVLGERLMVIGRQVQTSHGKLVDLLAVDADGTLRVLELKRDRAPREVVAQVLDYGSWVQTLSNDGVRQIFEEYRQDERAFEEAFADRFGVSAPDELNENHALTIVAASVDPAVERLVAYLHSYGVPINVAFFRHFDDGGASYVARAWLIDDERSPVTKSSSRTREPWNHRDWYVSFGSEAGTRGWDDARRYGFVSAGGGLWYSRTLRSLPTGARVWVCVPKSGYVGVGEVTAEAMPADSAMIEFDGQQVPFRSLELTERYHHGSDKPEDLEYVVPVRWLDTRPLDRAVWENGMFANQNSACKLRNKFTLDQLRQHFNVDNDDD